LLVITEKREKKRRRSTPRDKSTGSGADRKEKDRLFLLWQGEEKKKSATKTVTPVSPAEDE